MITIVCDAGPIIRLWNAAHGHLSREEAEQALSNLEASSLWLSARIHQEARQSLNTIYTSKR